MLKLSSAQSSAAEARLSSDQILCLFLKDLEKCTSYLSRQDTRRWQRGTGMGNLSTSGSLIRYQPTHSLYKKRSSAGRSRFTGEGCPSSLIRACKLHSSSGACNKLIECMPTNSPRVSSSTFFTPSSHSSQLNNIFWGQGNNTGKEECLA